MEGQSGRPAVFGVLFDNVTVEDAAARAGDMVRHGPYHYCAGTNANLLRMARRDPDYRAAINGADMSLADGAGVIWAARILGAPLAERVSCIEVLETLLPRLDGTRVYILGGKPGTAEQARDRLQRQYPRIVFCGVHHGYFQDPEAMAREIAACAPEFLLVCLGSPKQEFFMARYGRASGAKLAFGCGGWIDIAAGTLKWAPQSWQKHDLEWAWRFLQEPWRIGRVCWSLTVPFLAWGERLRRAAAGGRGPWQKSETDKKDPGQRR